MPKNPKKSRGVLLSIGILLVFVLLTGTYLLNNNVKLTKTEHISAITRQVTLDELKVKIEDKKNVVLYIGRDDCSDCNVFEPAFIELIKDKNLENKIYYLDVQDIKKDEAEWKEVKELLGFNYTPALLRIRLGEKESLIQWNPTDSLKLSDVSNWLDKNF